MEYLEELRNGKVEFLSDLTLDEKIDIIELVNQTKDCGTILKTIIPIFRNTDNWYEMPIHVFKLIYLKKEFEEETKYLLNQQYVKPEDFISLNIEQILEKTSWGLDYIYNHLEELPLKVISPLIIYLKDKNEIYLKFLDRVLKIPDQEIRDFFMRTSIIRKVSFDLKNVVKCLYQNPNDFDSLLAYSEKPRLNSSSLPKFLLFYSRENMELEKIMTTYFEIFFEAESEEKMRLLNNFINKIPKNSLEEYREFLKLYHYQQTIDIDRKLTILSSHNQELLMTNYLKDKVTSYLKSGSITSVFRVGDEVLKLSLKKYEPDTERELFLIAPTNLQVIYDLEEKPILYVERQPYLSRQHHGQEMTSRDVINFMEELDRQGFEVTDPHCISGSFDNFGFLNDYHDANITGFKSAEDLPDWFKERPIVLYDVDLIYQKGIEKKKTFQ